MGVTIKDIAKESGFSKSTVSRVLVGDPNVKPDTRERIKAVMERMGYQNNELARGMVKGRIDIVLVIAGDLLHHSYGQSMRAVESELYKGGYMTIVCNSEYDTQKEFRYMQLAREFQLAGVILMTAIETPELHRLLKGLQCPVVLINRCLSHEELDTVVLDNLQGAYQATRYLIERGHRMIRHVAGPRNSSAGLDRRWGYLKAMEEYGLPVTPDMILEGDLLAQSGYRAAQEIHTKYKDTTAVFVAGSKMAEGFVLGCASCGLKIPEQISLLHFDHLIEPDLYAISPTTVGNDQWEMGRKAAELLLRRLNGDTGPAQCVVYPCAIREGKSVQTINQATGGSACSV